VPDAENFPLKVPTSGAVLGIWSTGNKIVDVIVSEPDARAARAAPGANVNTPATATNKTTARPRPCANNEPNPRALLTIIEITPDPKTRRPPWPPYDSATLRHPAALSNQPNEQA
jgi:hypothetical protein